MKKLLLCSLLCLPAPALAPLAAQAKPAKKMAAKSSSVVWRTDYDSAMKEAKKSGKPVFVDFYTDWCGWCKELDRTTYRDPKFVRESRNWVMVKLNAEKGARNIEITRQNQVSGFPTLLMLDGSGKVLNKVPGYCLAPAMLAEMKKAQAASGVLSARIPLDRRAG